MTDIEIIVHEDVDRYLELEDIKFLASLVQTRIKHGLPIESVARAADRGWKTLKRIEDLDTDVHLSTIRRYAALVGAHYQHRVLPLVKHVREIDVDSESSQEPASEPDPEPEKPLPNPLRADLLACVWIDQEFLEEIRTQQPSADNWTEQSIRAWGLAIAGETAADGVTEGPVFLGQDGGRRSRHVGRWKVYPKAEVSIS